MWNSWRVPRDRGWSPGGLPRSHPGQGRARPRRATWLRSGLGRAAFTCSFTRSLKPARSFAHSHPLRLGERGAVFLEAPLCVPRRSPLPWPVRCYFSRLWGGSGVGYQIFIFIFFLVQVSAKTEGSFVSLGGVRVTFSFAITFPQASLSVLV